MALNRQNGSGGNMTTGDYASGMSSIRLSEIPRSFIRQLPWMFIVFVVLAVVVMWATRDIKRQYVADGRLFVQIGPEYVYDPATGSNQSGITITPDMVVLTEIDIIKNSTLIGDVIQIMINDPEVGGERFAPKLYEKYEAARIDGSSKQIDLWNDIVKMVEKSYNVSPKPKSSIINLEYKHEDGEVAVKTLTAFMEAYFIFRKEKFVINAGDDISERRMATEEQLKEIETEIQNILNKNGISEFTAEQQGVQTRAEALRTALNTLRGNLAAAEAALATTEDQLRTTPQTLDLYVEDRASGRLAQAELEKRQLLAKYLPTSNPVRAKEAEIAEIRAQVNSYGGKANGTRRVGPNTVYQGLMTQRNTYQAQADSFREQETLLVAQVTRAVGKVKRMRILGPRYNDLVRQQVSLEQQVVSLTTKEQESLVNKNQQGNSGQNITEITRPKFPRKGRNMKKIMRALGFLAALFSIFMLALLRVFLDPKIYGANTQAQIPAAPAPAPYAYDNYEQPAYAAQPDYPQPYENPIPDSVPEPVPHPEPNYAPEPVPEFAPEYAPAAYGTLGGGMAVATATPVFESHAYDTTHHGQIPSDMGVYPDGTQAWDAQSQNAQTYADGTPAVSMPTPMENAQNYNAMPMQDFAGPEQNIPVLGQVSGATDVNPYAS